MARFAVLGKYLFLVFYQFLAIHLIIYEYEYMKVIYVTIHSHLISLSV